MRRPLASTRLSAWAVVTLAACLHGCPTASTPDVGSPAPDAAPLLDAELVGPDAVADAGVLEPDAALPDADTAPDAALPDAEAVDVGFALRGALRPGTTEAQVRGTTLRARLSVSTSTRARTRTHSLQGGLGPLGS